MIRSGKPLALFLGAVALVADQASKWSALTTLRGEGGHVELTGPVDLTLHFNQSNAFGLTPVIGNATRWVLMGANLGVAAVILYLIVTRRFRGLTNSGLALIMAGAVGNALDRLTVGSVVDFIDASEIGFAWIFNVADASIDVGIALLILGMLLNDRRARSSADPRPIP